MMLDAAAGFAASRHLSEGADLVPVITLNLNTSYIGAVREGTVVATGRVTVGGHKIVYATAQITDLSGAVLSSGAGVLKRVSI